MFAGAVSDVEMQEHYDEFFEVRRTVGKGPARSPSVPGGAYISRRERSGRDVRVLLHLECIVSLKALSPRRRFLQRWRRSTGRWRR